MTLLFGRKSDKCTISKNLDSVAQYAHHLVGNSGPESDLELQNFGSSEDDSGSHREVVEEAPKQSPTDHQQPIDPQLQPTDHQQSPEPQRHIHFSQQYPSELTSWHSSLGHEQSYSSIHLPPPPAEPSQLESILQCMACFGGPAALIRLILSSWWRTSLSLLAIAVLLISLYQSPGILLGLLCTLGKILVGDDRLQLCE